jgi:Glycosyl hydrolases family 2, TIM barrel domain/Glycosyl hydrolases family 2/Glycosyl hydrolase 2 galactose-binding domain-like
MRRRRFLGVAGAYAALTGARVQGQNTDVPKKRQHVDLNGAWKQSIAGNFVRIVQVPSSNRPIGHYDLEREFALPRLSREEHAMLHFEGIAYFARVSCNGKELGSTIPYVPQEFDISAVAKERSNVVRVSIADLPQEGDDAGADEIALGVNPGWEAYGGIIRDAWIELRPATFIENAQLKYALQPGFSKADCSVRIFLRSRQAARGSASVKVTKASQVVGQGSKMFSLSQGQADVEIGFQIADPALWSPDSPDLYDAAVSIETGASTDVFMFRTGFREFAVQGTGFELNGKPIKLLGVCRHDMWKDQGFTLTRRQMRHDMQGIKAMGANYVRLVHYPHDRYVVELADELGLLVSEEPGFWQVDFRKAPQSMGDLGIRILERTIRRDWNSPSVIAWLLANECDLTADYLIRGKAMCRETDPLNRLVSAANNMRKEDAKPIFEQAGMDFFDDHPYTFDVSEFQEISKFYGDSKPLTFTEWGGKEIGQSRYVMPESVDHFLTLQNSSKLAGTAFWSWQDLPQFSRIDPEMRHGILESGVVTEGREPRERIVMELRRYWEGRDRDSWTSSKAPEILTLRHAPWAAGASFSDLKLGDIVTTAAQVEAWRDFERLLAEFWAKADYAGDQWQRTGGKLLLWRGSKIELLGVPFAIPEVEGYARPIVLTPNHPETTIPVGRSCSQLHALGHITCPSGYPPSGVNGAVACTLHVQYKDSSEQTFPLRHGYEVARGNMIYQTTRIDPIATKAQRALRFVKDPAREDYQVLLCSFPVRTQAIESIRYQLSPGEQPFLLFAINAES